MVRASDEGIESKTKNPSCGLASAFVVGVRHLVVG